MLQKIPVTVQGDEIVVEVLGDMLHKQNFEPFGYYMILTGECEVFPGLLRLLVEDELN